MKSKTTRLAAASVLAITIPLAPTAALASPDTAPSGLNHAKAFAHQLDGNANRTGFASTLSTPHRAAVLHAVDSAIAASTEAITAIKSAQKATTYLADQAREDIQDAITALQAAIAEATYVLDEIPQAGLAFDLLSEIRQDMRLLESQLS
ncbi:hypothetical protein V5R04_12905 [Jonesiaceae bacterium BS-20]|uniref:Uncharacterized protein n=1 Tax=Jonesiaceae bacterium BS-20 TaxID=3120821 RepID=A0AAU7DVV8_9MICO